MVENGWALQSLNCIYTKFCETITWFHATTCTGMNEYRPFHYLQLSCFEFSVQFLIDRFVYSHVIFWDRWPILGSASHIDCSVHFLYILLNSICFSSINNKDIYRKYEHIHYCGRIIKPFFEKPEDVFWTRNCS